MNLLKKLWPGNWGKSLAKAYVISVVEDTDKYKEPIKKAVNKYIDEYQKKGDKAFDPAWEKYQAKLVAWIKNY